MTEASPFLLIKSPGEFFSLWPDSAKFGSTSRRTPQYRIDSSFFQPDVPRSRCAGGSGKNGSGSQLLWNRHKISAPTGLCFCRRPKEK